MTRYDYRAIPAPVRGDKEKGLKTGAERFAHAIEAALNEMGAEGWEYVRAETLPSEERAGLTGKTTVFHNLLIFRRAADATAAAAKPGPSAMAAEEIAAPASRPESAPPAKPEDKPPLSADPRQR